MISMRIFRDKVGATAIEYAFIASFIALAMAAGASMAGWTLNHPFFDAAKALNEANGGSGPGGDDPNSCENKWNC